MADIRVHVDASDADRKIRLLATALSDLRPFWPMVVPLVTGWWKRQFDTQGAFAGAAWRPLAPSTLLMKHARGLRPYILQETGQLKQAASRPIRTVSPTSLNLEIDDSGPEHGPVLQFHQEGKGVPKRPLVFGDPLPHAASAELERAADRYISDLLRRA